MCEILTAKEGGVPPIDRGNDNNAIHKMLKSLMMAF